MVQVWILAKWSLKQTKHLESQFIYSFDFLKLNLMTQFIDEKKLKINNKTEI